MSIYSQRTPENPDRNQDSSPEKRETPIDRAKEVALELAREFKIPEEYVLSIIDKLSKITNGLQGEKVVSLFVSVIERLRSPADISTTAATLALNKVRGL